jgi:Fe-S cluster biogenesis protein NfuA
MGGPPGNSPGEEGMKLLSALKSAFGVQKPLEVRDPNAIVAFGEGARAWFASAPPGTGVHFELVPLDLGRAVHAEEGESQGPAPELLGDLPVTMSDGDFAELRGLQLDRRDDRWSVAVDLEIRARETPNPDGRLYLVDRALAVERPLFFTGAGPHPGLPTRLLRIPGIQSVLLRENTCAVERVPGTSWEEVDREIDAAIRAYFLTCGHEIEPDEVEFPPEDDAFKDDVWKVLQERILPGIHRDGGNLELVAIQDGIVRVSMVGSCRSCPSSTITLRMGVERVLKEAFPGRIARVEQV